MVADLVAPRMKKVFFNALADLPEGSFHADFDKFIMRSGEFSTFIPFCDVEAAFARDDYRALDHAATSAARYLRAMRFAGSGRERRDFRTKQRNILARRK